MSELITSREELEQRVMDVADVVAWEQEIAASGTPLEELMCRAGAAVAGVAVEMLEQCYPPQNLGEDICIRTSRDYERDGIKTAILCGSGNNGGDGWVASELLAAQGYPVIVVSRDAATDLKAEPARTNALFACESGGFEIVLNPNAKELAALLNSSSLIIDAILGTGFAHDTVREPYNEWIALANRARVEHDAKILAVDCPSGLNAQTGVAAASCIEADLTITMLAVKTGFIQPSAASYLGDLRLATLGVNARKLYRKIDFR